MIQKVLLTENKRAEIIYPSNITVEDIRLIQAELDKIAISILPGFNEMCQCFDEQYLNVG